MTTQNFRIIFNILDKLYLLLVVIVLLLSIGFCYSVYIIPANQTNITYGAVQSLHRDILKYREYTDKSGRKEALTMHYEAERRGLFDKFDNNGKRYFSDLQRKQMLNRKIATEQELLNNNLELLFNNDGSLSNLSENNATYKLEHFKKVSVFATFFHCTCFIVVTYLLLLLPKKCVIWAFNRKSQKIRS